MWFLGKLAVDMCFLEDLIQIQAEQPLHKGYQVFPKLLMDLNRSLDVFLQKGLAKTAVETVQYLEKRKNFWRHTVEKN